MNLAAVCKRWQTQVLPSLCSPPGKVIPCGMSLLPHGKWLLGGPWSCFDATGTSFKCGWASGSCCSAGRHSNQANKIFLSWRALCLWGVWCLSSALLWRGSDGYWGAKRPCLRTQGGWNSSWVGKAGVVGLRDWPGGAGAGWGFVAAAAQPHALLSALLCAQSWGF